jgi:hypothetical protein
LWGLLLVVRGNHMTVKACGELGTVWKDASAIEEGTEGVESPGFHRNRAQEADVLNAWEEWHGGATGLLIPFEDYSVRVGHTARPISVWLEILTSLSPLLRGQEPAGHALAEENVWNQLGGDLPIVRGPGPANSADVSGLGRLDADHTAIVRLGRSHKISLAVGE